MRQVRVCRSSRIEARHEPLASFNAWTPATPDVEEDFQVIVSAGNEVFGKGTHWIEERHVPDEGEWPDAKIWKLLTDSMQAWTRGDMDEHTAYFTPDAILVTPIGSRHLGHDDIHRAFSEEHALMPNKRLQVLTCHISYPGPATAVVLMEGRIEHDNAEGAQGWASTQTIVERQGRWLIASHHVFHPR